MSIEKDTKILQIQRSFCTGACRRHAAQEHAPALLPLLELAAFLTVPNTEADISMAEAV